MCCRDNVVLFFVDFFLVFNFSVFFFLDLFFVMYNRVFSLVGTVFFFILFSLVVELTLGWTFNDVRSLPFPTGFLVNGPVLLLAVGTAVSGFL